TTDDRGAYRIYDLPPGDYAVAVQPRNTTGGPLRLLTAADVDAGPAAASSPATAQPAMPPLIAYAQVYYPATPLAAAAASISLADGEERSNVDIRTALVPLARVEGSIADATGGPGPRSVQ